MALVTTCPQCSTSFKVRPDQLKRRRGLVRCGMCQDIFSGIAHLSYVDHPESNNTALPSSKNEDLDTAFFLPTIAADQNFEVKEETLKNSVNVPTQGFPNPLKPEQDSKQQRDSTDSSLSRTQTKGIPSKRIRTPESSENKQTLKKSKTSNLSGIIAQTASLQQNTEFTSSRNTQLAHSERTQNNKQLNDQKEQSEPSSTKRRDFVYISSNSQKIQEIEPFSDAKNQIYSLKKKPKSTLWIVAISIAFLISSQVFLVQESNLATAFPQISSVLEQFLPLIGVTLEAPKTPGSITIESFEIIPVDAQKLRIAAILRNRTSQAVFWPSIRLDLREANGEIGIRRILTPKDYQVTDPEARPRSFPGTSEWHIHAEVFVEGMSPSSYSAQLFYK